MANTADLIALQAEYPTAFADPEDPTLPEPDEEGRTGETPQDGTLLGEAIASNLETMHPDQARDFAEGHLQAAQLILNGDHLDYLLNKEPASKTELYGNMDAQVWAKEFCEKLKDSSFLVDAEDAIGTMIGWFANAIMTGYDNGYSAGLAAAQTVSDDSGVIEFNLPETNARQGSVDCPSGMCPIDH